MPDRRPLDILPPNVPPHPADAGAARLRERFALLGATERRLSARPDAARLLDAIGGNSPHLSDLALREARTLRATLLLDPGRVVDAELRALRATPPTATRAQVALALRRAKRRIGLATAAADLRGAWRLEQVTAALSALADACLSVAVAHLLRTAHDANQMALPDPAQPETNSGFAVLAMGKLGGRELNYSSDIDLILLHDPACHPAHAERISAVFNRLARHLVALMEARDADGYVFRTDLRLRPDPASTPPAISIQAALAYYESLGQSWERAAMIKARPVAGDVALAERFLAEMRPFVWRRHLDFAAIADLRGMKRRIDDHKNFRPATTGTPCERAAGRDVKLGHGGIREIEFVAQTLQLVWAGRDPALRTPDTLAAIRALRRAGHLSGRAAAELTVSYRFLRQVEHRLQMVDDRQTHALPADPAAVARFAAFMGHADPDAFARRLIGHLSRVRARYAEFFEPQEGDPEAEEAMQGRAVPAFVRASAETEAADLRDAGYLDPARALSTVAEWRAGKPRALRAERARGLLEEMLPALLGAVARQARPDQVLARFDDLLGRLGGGVQMLSLLARNQALLARLAGVLGAAPRLATHLVQTPGALDALLAPSDVDPDPDAALRARLHDARSLEGAIALIRRFVREEEFRLSVATLEARLDVDRAGRARSALARAAIAALLPRVSAEHAELASETLAVVALGKAGAGEMMHGSDLDLMLVYDPGGAEAGPRQTRLAHRLVAALTAPGPEGPLYAVDMRLRPSGNKGPVAVSLPAFERYHRDEAWTWERMALTRARVVAGPPGLCARVRDAITTALLRPRDSGQTRADAHAMRARMLRERPRADPTDPIGDVKQRPGGLVEVEFVAQALQLQHAAAHPQVLAPGTGAALWRLVLAGAIEATDAETLTRADRLWRAVQDMRRITADPAPLLHALHPGGTMAELGTMLDDVAAAVRAIFARVLGDPEAA